MKNVTAALSSYLSYKMLYIKKYSFIFDGQHCIKPDSVFAGLDPGRASAGRCHSESGSTLSVLQVSK